MPDQSAALYFTQGAKGTYRIDMLFRYIRLFGCTESSWSDTKFGLQKRLASKRWQEDRTVWHSLLIWSFWAFLRGRRCTVMSYTSG